MPSPPAALIAGPAPPPILHARVQAPVPHGARAGRFPISSPPLRGDSLCRAAPRHSRLCYSSAHQCHSLPSRSRAKQGLRVNSRSVLSPRHRRASPGIAKPFRRFAALCFSVASRALRCFDSPPRCRAVLRRGWSLHFRAIASLRPAKHRLRCPYQSIAVARRGFASPSPRAALLRSAVAVLVASWPSYPMPLRRASLPVLRGAVRCFAPPSPCLALLRLSIPLPFHAWPSISVAGLRRAFLFRRRSAQCEAPPSPP